MISLHGLYFFIVRLQDCMGRGEGGWVTMLLGTILLYLASHNSFIDLF